MKIPFNRTDRLFAVMFLASLVLTLPAPAYPQDSIVKGYEQQARKENSAFSGFSAKRGQALFNSSHTTGKPDTPSCTSCHTQNPQKAGLTRAGKEILPLALSQTPERYSDPSKVEKWFRRNCKSVLGRSCTPLEKGDFLTFVMNQ